MEAIYLCVLLAFEDNMVDYYIFDHGIIVEYFVINQLYFTIIIML